MCDKQACRVSGHITDPLKQVRQAIKKIAQKISQQTQRKLKREISFGLGFILK